MKAVTSFKEALVIEGDATPMVPLSLGHYLAHMEPFEVTISEEVHDERGDTFIAFRGIGRRAYMLIQQDHIQVFWTVAGNGTSLECIDSIGDANSFGHLTLLRSIMQSIGRAQKAELDKPFLAPVS